MGGESGRFKIVVTSRETGATLWVNHGYTPDSKSDEAFEAICGQIEYFPLEGFLRRQPQGVVRRK